MAALERRIARLEKSVPKKLNPDECPRPCLGAIVVAGEPMPAEQEIHPCKTCGGRHVLEIVLEVVEVAPPPSAGDSEP
jgi:hypothetical protein